MVMCYDISLDHQSIKILLDLATEYKTVHNCKKKEQDGCESKKSFTVSSSLAKTISEKLKEALAIQSRVIEKHN